MIKRMMLALTIVFVLSVSLTACETKAEQESQARADVVLAKVNDREITQDFIDKTFETWLFMGEQTEASLPKSKAAENKEGESSEESVIYGRREGAIVKTNILDLKIKGILIEELYKKNDKLISEEELEKKYEVMMKLMEEKMPEVLNFYKEKNIDKEFIKEGIKTNYYLAKFSEELETSFRKEYTLSQDEYKKFKLTVNPGVILLQDRETADMVYKRIQHGDKFENLVKEYSVDETSKLRNGEMGSVRLDELPVEFSIHLKDLNRGDITEPFQSVFGYTIIKLIDFKSVEDMLKDAALTDSEEAALKAQVFNQQYMIKEYEEFNHLKAQAEIEIFKDFYKEDAK